MAQRLLITLVCMTAVIVLAGCNQEGNSFSGLFDFNGSSDSGSFTTAGLTSSSSSTGGSSGTSIPHNPEPATLALLGSGLFAYAFLRKRKNK